MFFPTNYGTVDITVAAAPGGGEFTPNPSRSDGGFSEAGQDAAVHHFTVEEHNARLEAELAKMRAEMEARIKKLESQVNQTQQAGSNEN